MKIYIPVPNETIYGVFRRMVASAQNGVKIYFPLKGKVFVADKSTKVRDLRNACRADYATCLLEPDKAEKFMAFWEALTVIRQLEEKIPAIERRHDKEWKLANGVLHSAYSALNLGGRQGTNFLVHYVSHDINATTSKRSTY